MKILLFGGSFDPVHSQHVALARAAKEALGADRLIVIPSAIAPHKRSGASADGAARIEACKIAFRGIGAEISAYEIEQGDTSYSYLTCEHFRARYSDAELYFLMGADMLGNFPLWKYPGRILDCVTLAVGGRGDENLTRFAQTLYARYGKRIAEIPFTGKPVSSSKIRVELAFGKKPEALDGEVYRFLKEKGLYAYSAVLPALALEKPERREHSFRVALTAVAHARNAGVSADKALLSAALHDCGKYVPLSSPLLKGFRAPKNVPPPVMHQYTGAFLAEHRFGVTDPDVLNAIRYHTSGREDMSPLERLILIADMLEPARDFEGIDTLRAALERDLDECLYLCLKRQLAYLRARNFPIYSLTERAFVWIKAKIGK